VFAERAPASPNPRPCADHSVWNFVDLLHRFDDLFADALGTSIAFWNHSSFYATIILGRSTAKEIPN
jgi:hypothetical protein